MGPNAKYVCLYVATRTAINVCIHVMSAAIVHDGVLLHTTKCHLCQELPPYVTNWSPPRKTLTAAVYAMAVPLRATMQAYRPRAPLPVTKTKSSLLASC